MKRSCTQKIKEPTGDIEDGNEKRRLTIDRGQRETQDQRGHRHHSGSSDATYSSRAGDHGRKRLGKMAQELSRTRRSPPPILTFDQASVKPTGYDTASCDTEEISNAPLEKGSREASSTAH